MHALYPKGIFGAKSSKLIYYFIKTNEIRKYLQTKNCIPQEDCRNLFASGKTSTLTMKFISPRIPCIVQNMGYHPLIALKN